MAEPSMYAHYRPTVDDRPDGTYRVVGLSDEAVTLLCVADADGRRVHTGQTVVVARDDFLGYELADNPDETFSLGRTISSTFETFYWTVRVFGYQFLTHPLISSIGVMLVLIGFFGDEAVMLPEFVSTMFVLVGTLSLVYIGSGRV